VKIVRDINTLCEQNADIFVVFICSLFNDAFRVTLYSVEQTSNVKEGGNIVTASFKVLT
jgi:hypothetical protein